MYLANNIRYLRKKNNYSQNYIADRLGYKSYTTIQKWEMGISEPPISRLKILAALFNVDINDMTSKNLEMNEEGDETKTKRTIANLFGINSETFIEEDTQANDFGRYFGYIQTLRKLGVTDEKFDKILKIYEMIENDK